MARRTSSSASVRPAGRQSGRQRRPLPRRPRRSSPARRCSRPTRTSSRCCDERGTLLHHEPFRHSYPHCWRHKTPVIFRATPQWFISMDQAGLRETALREIRKVQWMPDWGEQRITGMIADRPDWCISRQRTWGVPIALFVHRETRRAAPAHRRADRAVSRSASSRTASTPGSSSTPRELLGAEAERVREGHRHHGRLGRLRRVAPLRDARCGPKC